MIRVLHVADVHLDAPLGAFGEAAAGRRAEVLEAFRRLPDRAEEEDVHAVLVAGDLFDSGQPSAEAVAAVRETFRLLIDAGRPVFLVPGNHDALTLHPNPWRRDLAGAHLFREPEFGEPVRVDTAGGPLFAYGLAHDPARCADPLATWRRAEGEGVHVALLHGAVPDSPHWGVSPNSLGLPAERLAALDADYVALGDYHRFRPPEAFGEGGAPACYSGSFAGLGFAERGPRGFVVAELAPGERPRVTLRTSGVTPVVELGELDVTRCEGAEQVTDAVAAAAARAGPEDGFPTVTLTGTPGFPLDMEELRTHLQHRFPAFRVRDETRHYASARLDELAAEETIVGHVVRLGRERIETASAAGDAARDERLALRAALRALGVR